MRHALLLILLSSVLLLNKNAEGRKRAASPLMHKQRHAWLAQLRELDPNILTDPDQIAAVCRIPILTGDPKCLHGGFLYATNVSEGTDQCGHCVCPDGWSGVDCSVCTGVDACPPQPMPDGSLLPAATCTADSMTPIAEEALTGKIFSCSCGGDDPSTQFLCNKQPDTSLQITIQANSAEASWSVGAATAAIIERAATPQQNIDLTPCDTRGKDDCWNATRYDYAYAGVWDGTLKSCSWSVGACISPLEGSDCLVFVCTNAQAQCPASYMQKCPGYTAVSCANAPGSNKPYWMHHCLPGTYPAAGKALRLVCKQVKRPDGRFQCYVSQEGSYVASLGMRCMTGTCIYRQPPPPPSPEPPYPPGPRPDPDPSPPTPPPPGPTPAPPGPPIIHVRQETALLVCIGIGMAGLVAAAGILTYRDSERAAKAAADPSFFGGNDYDFGPTGAEPGVRAGRRRGLSSPAQPLEEPLLSAAVTAGIPQPLASMALGVDGYIPPGNGDASSYSALGQLVTNASSSSEPPLVPLVLSWHNLHLYVVKANGHVLHILKGVSGLAGPAHALGPGQATGPTSSSPERGADAYLSKASRGGGAEHTCGSMLAVLGPSGAGKTSMLDVLSGRRGRRGVSGQLRINGHLVPPAKICALSGFVAQDDVLPGTLSTLEYLSFNALLRMPPHRYSQAARDARVWALIRQLGLQKVAHAFIGDAYMRGLSGGEKRRVSIAVELLTRPGLLLLDEPTTGLDSTNASRVCEVLAGLASNGVNVILSIHQPRPDVLRAMDRMMLLSGEGRVVYTGPVTQAREHFTALGFPPPTDPSVNITDFLLDLVIKSPRDVVASMVTGWQGSVQAAADAAATAALADAPQRLPPPKYRPGYWLQMRALSTRLLRNTYRHPFLVMLNFVATLVTAIATGLMFHHAGTDTAGIQNRLGALFFMLLYLSLMSLSSLPVWRDEKLLFMRERAAGVYGTGAYFSAKLLFDVLPLRVVPPAFFALFSYWMVGLHPSSAPSILWFIVVLVGANITSTTMCMAIGAAAASNALANLGGSLLLLLLLLFGGFLLNKDRVPTYCRWIERLSFFNYAYEALAMNEFIHFPMDFTFTAPIPSDALPPLRITGEGVLREFGFATEPVSFYSDLFGLAVLACLACAATYIILELSGRSLLDGLEAASGHSMNWVNRSARKAGPILKRAWHQAISTTHNTTRRLLRRLRGGSSQPDAEESSTPAVPQAGVSVGRQGPKRSLLSSLMGGFKRSRANAHGSIGAAVQDDRDAESAHLLGPASGPNQVPQNGCNGEDDVLDGGLGLGLQDGTALYVEDEEDEVREAGLEDAPELARSESANLGFGLGLSNAGNARGSNLVLAAAGSAPVPQHGAGVPERAIHMHGKASPHKAVMMLLHDAEGGDNPFGRHHVAMDAHDVSASNADTTAQPGECLDVTGMGVTDLLQQQAAAAAAQRVVLSWENLTVRVQLPRGKARYVLQGVSGVSGPQPARSASALPLTAAATSSRISSMAGAGLGGSASGMAPFGSFLSTPAAAAAAAGGSGYSPEPLGRLEGPLSPPGTTGGVLLSSTMSTNVSSAVPEPDPFGEADEQASLAPHNSAKAPNKCSHKDSTHMGHSMGQGTGQVRPMGLSSLLAPAAAEGEAPAARCCLFAIVGPSGAGKTTLMDVLSGRRHGTSVTGEIRLNGLLVGAAQLRKACGYVAQEIVLPGTSTVTEYLTFHAQLRMREGSSTPSVVVKRVQAIMDELGLHKVANSLIGDEYVRGLSGGEKRRVSIAVELLTRPGLLLLDEPTTGLDSTNAARCCEVLAMLAAGGVNVVLSIHQPRPDVLRAMDRIMLLSGEGRVVYTGPTAKIAAHFAMLGYQLPTDSAAVADAVLELVIRSPPAVVSAMSEQWRRSDAAAEDSAWLGRLTLHDALMHNNTEKALLVGSRKYEASFSRQLTSLSARRAAGLARHPLLLALHYLATGVVALAVGGIYWHTGRDTGGIQDRFGALFFMLLYLSLMSLSSLPVWRDEKLLFMRERAAGVYGTGAYFISVVLFDFLPLRVLPPILFSCISYWMIGLRGSFGAWLANLVVLVLANVAAAALNMSIGAALGTGVSAANALGCLALLLSTLLGGFLLSRARMPAAVRWAANLSYVRYAFEALLCTEFAGATGYRFTGFHQPGAPPDQIPYVDVTGDQILQTFGFEPSARGWDIACLAALAAAFLASTFVLLRFTGRP